MTDSQKLLADYVEKGSEAAFHELVARYVDLVYSAAFRLVEGDAHRAEDVAQTVFVDLARAAGTLSQEVMLGGWLHRHTCFVAAKTMRGERRRQTRERQAVEMNALLEDSETNFSQVAPLLDEAINELGDEDRKVILQRFFEQHDFSKIGETMGSSADAARMRVNRALEKLQSLLQRRGVTSTATALSMALSAHAVQASPVGLALAISTASALAGKTIATTTAATKAIAMTTLQKGLIASAVAFAVIGGGATYLVHHFRAARSSFVAVAAASSSPATKDGAASTVSGILKTPDGKPLPNAEVFLSTDLTAVPVYSAPSAEVASTVTGRDGQFSFPAGLENRAVIVIGDHGYGQATINELAARPELTLQPWARVEGTLRRGATPLARETIHLSRTRFGSKLQEQTFRTVHDMTAQTDADGHYVFARVAPGDTWISWRVQDAVRYDVQFRYFDLQPGQSLVADIGGRGRPITGRAVLADSDEQIQFFGSIWPRTAHQMPRPPNWKQLSPEEQDSLTAAWEKSSDAKLYNQERCPFDFRLAADGTFTAPDLPAGVYRVSVTSWTGLPMSSRITSQGYLNITVPEMPGDRSDEPLDIGVVKTISRTPLRTGDRAPLFETSTFDGKPLLLATYKGTYVLIHFWRTDALESLDAMADLKAAQSAWGQDKRFMLIGLNFDATLSAAQQYATNNGLNWTQCFLGKTSDVPNRYRLRRPTALLIGPDGRIVEPDLEGAGIASALEAVFGVK